MVHHSRPKNNHNCNCLFNSILNLKGLFWGRWCENCLPSARLLGFTPDLFAGCPNRFVVNFPFPSMSTFPPEKYIIPLENPPNQKAIGRLPCQATKLPRRSYPKTIYFSSDSKLFRREIAPEIDTFPPTRSKKKSFPSSFVNTTAKRLFW